MTKRETIFAISGLVLLVAAFAGRSALLRATRVEQPGPPSWIAGYAEPSSKGPRVIMGEDSQYWRLKNVVRVDVRQGLPHTRDRGGVPIRDLVSYIDAEAGRTGAEYVVISASREEKIGGVVAVIDECRKTRVRAVILNEYLDAFAAK
jgi:hypothetical protein